MLWENAGKNGRKAPFTLIEMLVVVAIIAILAALLAPTPCKSREQAKGLTSLNDLRQIGGAAPPACKRQGFKAGVGWHDHRP